MLEFFVFIFDGIANGCRTVVGCRKSSYGRVSEFDGECGRMQIKIV